MYVDVVPLPALLPRLAGDETVVVFDVLRATTTIAAALAAGVGEIHVFGGTDAARVGRLPDSLLCGEERCLPPTGFDLGNSPGAFQVDLHRGRSVSMSTTNGTRAILAARTAGRMFCGALVNAASVAQALVSGGSKNVLLLCAGTNGNIAAEDLLGAGAVIQSLRTHGSITLRSDVALMAEDLFLHHRDGLANALRHTLGGQNVLAAGLNDDIDFSASLNSIDVVGEAHMGRDVPVIRKS